MTARRHLHVVGAVSSDTIRDAAHRATRSMLAERTAHAEVGASLVDFAAEATSLAMARTPPGKAIACEVGCAYCCHLKISVTSLEAIAIGAHLRRTLSSASVSRLRRAVREVDERTHGLSTAERASARVPCPLLGADQRCVAYEVRPLRCTGANSFSKDACKAAFDGVAGADAPIEFYGLQKHGADAIAVGVALALDEVRLDPRPLELVAALRIVLDDSNIAARWQRGERVFERAVDTEALQLSR
ncbi:MAG: YkgJ family cysteine cluster protein [Polyangiaceae bacterium]